MTIITLITEIKAPIKKVFDLSRDIDFHQKSASQTKEQAISGVTSGIINLGETVKWRGKHFGIWLTHESLITECIAPSFFVDEMIDGNFKEFRHQHHFTEKENITIMKDILEYKMPYGFIGSTLDYLVVKKHLKVFLKNRNNLLKKILRHTNVN